MTARGPFDHARSRALVVGSFNQAKAAEMAELLRGLEVPIRSLRDFPAVRPVPETGETFAENAREKALGLARQIGGAEILGVVADDSGLEVDALGGRPGVRSARYVSESATDPERVLRLLEELDGLPAEQRTARFRCHVALANAERVLIETAGAVEGRIAFAPAGAFGFGYDPIFIPRGFDRTFGEIGAELKPRISHRAVALREFRERLKRMLDRS
ncbi:MAG: non-canonical purine NTP pyrophosphatase [Candidatus Brocadiia bacterium]